MDPHTLMKPKEFVAKTLDGDERIYILHRFDAWAGREICTQYPFTGMISGTKLGEYAANAALAQKLLAFVGVKVGDTVLALTTRELVRNHIPDWEVMGQIEIAMMQYNCSFFFTRKDLDFLRKFHSEDRGYDYQNVDGLLGTIIESGKATLAELRTIYTLEDAFLIWESIVIPRFNNWLAMEREKRRRQMRQK